MFRRSGQNILIVIGLEFSYVFHKKCRQWYYSYGIVGFIEIPRLPEDENYKADTRLGVEVEYIPAKSA